MSSLVIVALPEADDPVWKVSSEKVPHMTILFLGPMTTGTQVPQIAQFLGHASNTSLTRFSLEIDRRGTLGSDEADVLFFDERWRLPEIKEFRSQLLKNEAIRKAYDSVEQFPEWTPHLTLGYPEAPAKDDAIEHRLWGVSFDRIALWFGDFEGVEFVLKNEEYMDVAMSDVNEMGEKAVADLLHYGVKGMRWGVRRKNVGSANEVVVSDKKRKLKTKGGKQLPADKDAIDAAILGQKVKGSGVKALSNQELQQLSTRMQLEQNVSRLQSQQPTNPGRKFVKALLLNTGKQQAQRVANDAATKKVDKMMADKSKKK